MAKKSSGESKAPLVIALAFFVLATLILGVLSYLAYADIDIARKSVADEKKKSEAASKLLATEGEKLLVYKVAFGTATDEERTNLQNIPDRDLDVIRKEHTALTEAVKKQLDAAIAAQKAAVEKKGPDGAKVNLDVAAADVFSWEWPEGRKAPDEKPKNALLDQVIAFHAANQVAKATYLNEIKVAEGKVKNANDKVAAYDAAVASLGAEQAKVQPAIDKAIKDYQKIADDAQKALKDGSAGLRTKLTNVTTQSEEKDLVIKKKDEEIAKAAIRIADQDAKLEVKDDPFAFDKPLGKILRRKGNVVEIDLGSTDNVRAGLTFSVQPSDTPERGLQSRMKMMKGENGQVPVVIPKGLIEVIEVLGPNSSQCRITSEANTIRDGVLVGDVLYNSAWRKGGADHVALFGIFDLDGDGVDDIKQLTRDLTRMGVVVDAYYDLEQKKWVGQITERTIYAVEGIIPFKNINAGESPGIITAKGAVRAGIDDARKVAKDRGSKVVKLRDFFPRIGYKAKLDITEDKIDQAAARYLIGTVAETPAEPK